VDTYKVNINIVEYYGIISPLSTIFQLYRDGQFYWWKIPEYLEKTIDLQQVTDKHDLIENGKTI
jgi:hypothetical protein